jgi:hypothetical protein
MEPDANAHSSTMRQISIASSSSTTRSVIDEALNDAIRSRTPMQPCSGSAAARHPAPRPDLA